MAHNNLLDHMHHFTTPDANSGQPKVHELGGIWLTAV